MRAAAFFEASFDLRSTLSRAFERARERSIAAGSFSALLHIALITAIVQMNVRSGDPSALPVLFVADFSPRAPIRKSITEPIKEVPPIAAEQEEAPPSPEEPQLADEPTLDAALASELQVEQSAAVFTASMLSDLDTPALTFAEEPTPTPAPPLPPELDQPQTRKVEVPPALQATLIERMTQAAQTMVDAEQTEVSWQENGREYRAVLKRDVALDSMDLEQIAATITTTDQGASMQTDLLFSRLAFSQFTHVIDRWDPNVQMHDDEIVGRFHSNSSFFVGYSSQATPKFKGKVTTAARGFRFAPGSRRRQDEMFLGGLETSAGRIDFRQQASAFALDANDPDAHVQRFTDDAHITLAADGSYTWQGRRSDVAQTEHYEVNEPLYLLAAPNATLFVRGVIAGRVLVYSPERIVIEGNLTYATDPRKSGNSEDYLGLVSDGNVEIARPYVTGRGDLHVDAAIFARKRFVVTNIDHPRSAKLWIYGSLTAGTMSASEPRYATKIEFDARFDRVRPPGFPSTNRIELASWDTTWREASNHASN